MYTTTPGTTNATAESKISATGKGIDIAAGGIFYNEFFFGDDVSDVYTLYFK